MRKDKKQQKKTKMKQLKLFSKIVEPTEEAQTESKATYRRRRIV